MLKLLLAQPTSSSYRHVAAYFLDFADELKADVTVLKPGPFGESSQERHSAGPGRRLYRRLLPEVVPAYGMLRRITESSRLFSCDLVLAGQENKGEWFGYSLARHLARTAWAPVLLIPPKASFKFIKNILVFDNQELISRQPVLMNLGRFWKQQYFLYPAGKGRRGRGSYHWRRFDETGYTAYPRLDISLLQSYINRHEINLVVAGPGSYEADSNILGKLAIPVLVFNGRNTAFIPAGNCPPGISLPAKAVRKRKV